MARDHREDTNLAAARSRASEMHRLQPGAIATAFDLRVRIYLLHIDCIHLSPANTKLPSLS